MGASCKLLANVPGQYSMECRATNANGTGSYVGMNITVNNTKSFSYQIYPNPVSNMLTVSITPIMNNNYITEASFDKLYDVKLYNINGKIVRSQKIKAMIYLFIVSKL